MAIRILIALPASMRNETNRLTPEQLKKLRAWLGQRMTSPDGSERSQRAVAAELGVSQSHVSNILQGATTTRGTAVQMLERGGGSVDDVIGDGAPIADTKYRERDKMPARGFALDALSLVYEEDFCDLVQQLTPPPGSEGWTTDSWVDHIVSLRKLWLSGHLRPKRLHIRSKE